jgi:hypothetical protein
MSRFALRARLCFLTVIVSMTGVVAPDRLAGQSKPEPCDKEIVPQPGELGYKHRETRCEGLYRKNISMGATESLRVVSLIAVGETIPIAEYVVTWPSVPRATEVTLEAHSFKPRTLYRMDTTVAGSTYKWAVDVLLQLAFKNGEFGVVASADGAALGRAGERVYLPVSLRGPGSSQRKTPADGRYELKLASNDELRGIALAIAGPLNAKTRGEPEAVKLGMSYRPSVVPLKVPLNLRGDTGLYEVTVSAERVEDSLPTATTVYIFHGR